MQNSYLENAQTTCKNVEKKYTYVSNFSTFSIYDTKTKKKHNSVLLVYKILNNTRNTRIFSQQVQRPATLLKRVSNTGVFL